MNPLNPLMPFVWPEPRILEKISQYEKVPPFEEVANKSNALLGMVSDLTGRGIDTLERWIEVSPKLKAILIVTVYPACKTKHRDLARLAQLARNHPDRLFAHIYPLDRVTDRSTNALCLQDAESSQIYLATGASGDLGLPFMREGHVNFFFRADPMLGEAFRHNFDWLWAKSKDILAEGMTRLPDLVLPEGSMDAFEQWQDYVSRCLDPEETEGDTKIKVDPETGDVTIIADDGTEKDTPTVEAGFEKLDELGARIARLYEKGEMVSIDKLSRIPPLDAPLDPRMFGDASELQRGNVTRRVSMRVSIIDEKTLKEIDKRRKGMRALLNKFTFPLADNMRWMPTSARSLFDKELKRVNEEGQKLISDLLDGGVDKFIEAKKPALVDDLDTMNEALGRPGKVSEGTIKRVIEGLKQRLAKAQTSNFLPHLSYSKVGFARTNSETASPWGQAFSLLSGIASFPRKAITDSFFFRGLKVNEDDLIEAMNVEDDSLCHDLGIRGIKDRCKAELALIARIEQAHMEPRDRCEIVCRILSGEPIKTIDEDLKKKETP